MKLVVDHLKESARTSATLAEFGKRLTKNDIDLLTDGFSHVRAMAALCMAWNWLQWLLGGEKKLIKKNDNAFVSRGIQMLDFTSSYEMRPETDLYLLHCSIFGAKKETLHDLLPLLVDAEGNAKFKPADNGELYASAWTGMLKYWILDDLNRAIKQSEHVWSAYRHPSFQAAPKTLVAPWLKGDWKKFVKAQKSDFDRLWSRARKDGTVISETAKQLSVTVRMFPVEQKWCWAHSALALLAFSKGVEVATDPFWFPPHALTVAK